MAVDLLHVPSAETEACRHVVAQRQLDGAVVRHPVVVPEEHELAEPQVPDERYDLLSHALLKAAVPDEGIGVMIDDIASQPLAQEGLGKRHARRVGDALAERSGGDLDPAGRIELGMALAVGSEFAEALDLVDGDLPVSAEVKEEYSSIDPCPLDCTNRSRSNHSGSCGLNLR